jgi:hypothetical protein
MQARLRVNNNVKHSAKYVALRFILCNHRGMKKTKVIGIRVSQHEMNVLKDEAIAARRTLSSFVKVVLEERVPRMLTGKLKDKKQVVGV